MLKLQFDANNLTFDISFYGRSVFALVLNLKVTVIVILRSWNYCTNSVLNISGNRSNFQTSQFQVGRKTQSLVKILQKQSVTLTVINNVLNKKTQQMLRTFRRGNNSIHILMTKSDKNSVTRASEVLFCHRRTEIEGFCQIDAASVCQCQPIRGRECHRVTNQRPGNLWPLMLVISDWWQLQD